MPTIKIYETVFYPWEEHEDKPREKSTDSMTFETASYRDWYGDYNDNEEWVKATDVTVAIALLTGDEFYASEVSDDPSDGVGVWYIEETDFHVYTSERTERTAHLYGFTDADKREIYKGVFKK